MKLKEISLISDVFRTSSSNLSLLESQQPANKLDQSLNRALRGFYILIQNPLTVSTSRLLYLGLHSEFGIADGGHALGEIREENLYLNDYGKIVEQVWNQLPDHFLNKVEIDAAVVMPNHFHGIIVNNEDNIANIKEQPIFYHQKTQLGNVIAYFKYQTTKLINQKRYTAGMKIWQRNYYDHVIRDKESLAILQKYVIENPLRWTNDQLYPDNVF